MRSRWPVAVGVVLLGVGVGRAQPPLPPPALPAIPPLPAAPPGGATRELPPLLPAPGGPLAEVPRSGGGGPGGEYDPGYLYLPERAPERARRPHHAEEPGPDGRWWVAPSLDLAWVTTRPAPAAVRLRVPDGLGGTLPGPVLPAAGQSAGRFESALGLTLGRWFGETASEGVDASLFVGGSENTFGGVAPGLLVQFSRGPGRGVPQVIALPDPLAAHVYSTFPVTLGTFFTTADVNYRHKLWGLDFARIDALLGYRFAYLEDELYLGESADDRDYRRNRASVSNAFHAGQIGLAGEFREAGWFVSASTKVAFGAVTPEVRTSGLFVGAGGRTPGGFRRLGGCRGRTRASSR